MHLREENIIEQITVCEVRGCHIYQECLRIDLRDSHFYKIADFHEEREGTVLAVEWLIVFQAMLDVKGSTVKMWLQEGYQNHDVLLIICYSCWMFDSEGCVEVVGNMKAY